MKNDFNSSTSCVIDGILHPSRNSLGNPIAQTKERLQNFWHWFGNSVAVDDEGRPRVFYVGVETQLDHLKPILLEELVFGISLFSQAGQAVQKEKGHIILCLYVKLENPIIGTLSQIRSGRRSDEAAREWTDRMLKLGKDGILKNSEEGTLDEIVVFSEAQIKSVSNSGAFFPESLSLVDPPENPCAKFEIKKPRFVQKAKESFLKARPKNDKNFKKVSRELASGCIAVRNKFSQKSKVFSLHH